MRTFLSKFTFKVDAKGRVSIPAAFRTTLVEFGSSGFLAFGSLTSRSIHCVTQQLVEQLTAAQNPMAAFGVGDPTLATIALPEIHPVEPDPDGRAVLPRALVEYAALDGIALFAGRGSYFEIWEPAAFEAHQQELRARLAPPGAAR
ncbi:MAG: division/cell wall cluster transcriptional repressor MraZ [Alphaproteobacteria bacterium]